MKGTSEERTGQCMDGGMEEAIGGGIERAREGNFKGGILGRALASIQYITNHPTTRPFQLIICYYK